MGHEKLLRDGMVSSLAAVDDFYYVNQVVPKTSTIRFEHEWLQLRDPRSAIPSIAKALRIDFWHWQEKHTHVPGDLEPALLRAALFWCAWIPKCLARKPQMTYRVEDMERAWPLMLATLGLAEDLPLMTRELGRFTSGATRVTYDDLLALDRNVGGQVLKLAEELGYAG